MERFFRVIKSYSALLAIALGGSTVALISHLSGLIPPVQGLLQITVVYQLLLLIVGYVYFFGAGIRKLKKLLLPSLVLTPPATLLHFFGLQVLTFRTGSGDLQIKGLECTAEAETVFVTSCPILSQSEIESAGNIYSDLWTDLGLAATSVSLSFLWLLLFSTICLLIAAFVSQQVAEEDRTKRQV